MKFEKYVYIHHIYSVYEIEKKYVYVYINSVYENMRYPVYIAFIRTLLSDREKEILTLLRINRSFMEFMRTDYNHLTLAELELNKNIK